VTDVSIWVAFWAGLASFISPCCLPLYPSYLSYLTGVTVHHTTASNRWLAVRHALFFTLGFSLVFFTLGFSVGSLAEFFKDNQQLLRQISALLIVAFGFVMLGLFKPTFLMRERKFQFRSKPIGYFGSLFIGIGFAAGWSPCVGPILGSILALSATSPGTWFPLISAYSLGFAIPFIAFAFWLGGAKALVRHSALLMKIGGAVMVLIGVLLYFDQLAQLTNWLNAQTPDWLKF
jgi:cytochrome c-type biogenesis protein